MTSSSIFRRVAGLAGKGCLGAVGASGATTWYIYKTDESWRRCIDFHVLITPLCWDYYSAMRRHEFDAADQKKRLEALHLKYAPELLGHVLALGGYYVKCAQMFCGMGMLPAAYEESFSCLLDGVPAKDFETVRRIVEQELGGKIEDHFESFDRKPIAAASIGQVHCARLKSSSDKFASVSDVVVKVQYPEVERFFELDVLSMRNLCALCQSCGIDIGIDEASLDKFFNEFTKSFAEEFDYRLEAKNMDLVRRNLLEGVSRTGGGRKYKETEVKIPVAVPEKTTRKVLTMERLQGEPIKRRMKRIMADMAAKAGKTVEEFEAEMKKKYEDPQQLKKLMQQRPPTGVEILLYKSWLRAGDVVRNFGRLAWNCLTFGGLFGCASEYTWSTLPLDTSKILPLIFAVHGQQLFVDGAFNADPHAGNILICDDNSLGLIDFGNVQRIPDVRRRKQLAELYLAMAKDVTSEPSTWNDQAIAQAFIRVAGDSMKNNTKFLAANALTTYDMRLDSNTLARFGIKEDMSNISDIMSREDFGGDSFREFPADLINLQRLCQTLVGVAGAVGAGQPSCAAMWRQQCEEVIRG
eukprot:TRINITY_DN13955_c0_g1_i1.p1 TRINITY_DN13955_c0_g1~~TRINITY_DN13955_c0_g1_i1.p1  ORF type:complete len:581 (+),score=96.55 TRINITY_DN13955_c0_g1_i1:46-1788(+)